MHIRAVNKVVSGFSTMDGAGVHLVRVLGHRTVKDFDPFLMLDAFDSSNPEDYIKGFPMHPHRGIETVTYLVEGEIEHQDSLGNKGVITGGGCQWMTAGRSILHQEMPRAVPRLWGLQLWVNLPAEQKMCPPKYRDITRDMLTRVQDESGEVLVLSGSYKGRSGPVKPDYVPASFFDITLHPNRALSLPVPAGDTVFAYIFSGECSFGESGTPEPLHHAVLLGAGDTVQASAGPAGARFVLVYGPPLREPIAWGGPIVMNTDAELKQAFFELENGSFIR